MKENLSEVGKAHEKERADMNAANGVLKAQLEKALAEVKDLQQQTSAMGASLEASKAETASAKAALSSLDKMLNELHDADEKAIVYTRFGVCVNDVQALLRVDYIFMRICTFSCSCDEQELLDKSEKLDGLGKKCK
jgi:DNA repair exonuclease SbcCD ATPase subunit